MPNRETWIARKFHETWLGLVQPSEGLVVSVPVLVDAGLIETQPAEFHHRLAAHVENAETGEPAADADATATGDGEWRIHDLDAFLEDILGYLVEEDFDRGDDLPDALSLWVEEGEQLLRPTMALRRDPDATPNAADMHGDAMARAQQTATTADTPAATAGQDYLLLVQEIPDGLDLDRSETVTGEWDYPPSGKLVRLMRACRVPIGLLTNRRVLRLIYAPHGGSTGWIDFRVGDMIQTGGRPIADALVMLLGEYRLFGCSPDTALPALLARSRERQADVTNELAEQVFDALRIRTCGRSSSSSLRCRWSLCSTSSTRSAKSAPTAAGTAS